MDDRIRQDTDPCPICGFRGKLKHVPNQFNALTCFSCGWTFDSKVPAHRSFSTIHCDTLFYVYLKKEADSNHVRT